MVLKLDSIKTKKVTMANLTKSNRAIAPWSVEVVAPGLKKEDFNLKVDDDILRYSNYQCGVEIGKKRRKRGKGIYSSFYPQLSFTL